MRNTKDKFLVYGGSDELVVSGYNGANFWRLTKMIFDYELVSSFVFVESGGIGRVLSNAP